MGLGRPLIEAAPQTDLFCLAIDKSKNDRDTFFVLSHFSGEASALTEKDQENEDN
jgi:hypothetical protein